MERAPQPKAAHISGGPKSSGAIFDIPRIIVNYNANMNGVDIADHQFRSYYNLMLVSPRSWMPLFFWLLDTTLVNAYFIYEALYPGNKISHKKFHLQVAWGLLEETPSCRKRPRDQGIVFPAGSGHLPVAKTMSTRQSWCLSDANSNATASSGDWSTHILRTEAAILTAKTTALRRQG
ncbi:hypothetical protein ON010_g188 [Phytophthora cinnamomi]|nr:hypothetical protein ON010_g188 [Phytophthora cinnamomi]